MSGKTLLLRDICALLLLVLSGCGSGDTGDPQVLPSIDKVSFRENTVPPGGTTSVRIEFNPGSDLTGYDSDGDAHFASSQLTMIVTLPAETTYVAGTSKVTDSVFGDQIFGHPDPRSPDLVAPCGDGRTILQYNFRRNEFGDLTDLDKTDLALKFDLQVLASADGASVEATSLIDPPSSACLVSPEKSAVLVVL